MINVRSSAGVLNGLLCLLVVIWVVGWFFTMVGLEQSKPFSFSALRFFLASVIMHLVICIGSRYASYTLLEWFYIFLVGVFQTTIMFSLASYGMLEVGLAKSAVLIYTTPVWTSLLGCFFLREKLSICKVFGLVLACFGVFLMLSSDLSSASGLGVFLLIGSSVAWSVSSVILKSKLAKKDAFCITAWQMTFGSIGLVVLAFYVDGEIAFQVSLESVVSLVYVSIFASVIAFTLWVYIVARVLLIRSSMASLAVPIIVFGIQEVREQQYLDFVYIAASVVIFLGLIVVNVGNNAVDNLVVEK